MSTIRRMSGSYHEYLISSLRDPEESAMYLETALEEDPEPELLKKAFLNVLEALGAQNLSLEQMAKCRQQIDQMFAQSGSCTIYELVNWLSSLGLKLTVTTDKSVENDTQETIGLHWSSPSE